MNPNFKTIILSDQASKTEINYIENINEYLKNLTLPFKLANTEDIIHNVYEGGFKIWECTLDILNFLHDSPQKIDLKDKSVLDLGCGQGLLGVYALKNSAKSVIFQDFNIEVLKYFTFVNLQLNFPNLKEFREKIRFISGDWNFLIEKIEKDVNEIPLDIENLKYDKEFDLILMSEVIYKVENYEKIAGIIDKLLKSQEGICILGTKFYYFGVGGSLPEFEVFLSKNYPMLKIIEQKEINTKKSNKRAIVLIKKI